MDWPDAIKPYGGSVAILRYKGAKTTNIAGIVFEGTFPGGSKEGKLVNLGVPFETIYYSDKRDSLMSKIMDFFEGKITKIAFNDLSPQKFRLQQNYPNPFNPVTTIQYELPKATQVTLEIYNMLGQRVRTLIQAKQAQGIHRVKWDGTNDSGQAMPSGVYIYRLKSKDFTTSRRMLLVR